ncbi:MAG: cytochrome c oxidase subunit II [Alphaproteobacteria bacterium]|nr:cytochrome c oxidase subunit II [Alphaproteobacteria bacterium]
MKFRVAPIASLTTLVLSLVAGQALAEDQLGQPANKAIDLQPAASQIRAQQIFFHNDILLPIITGIVLLVLVLLVYVIVRFNKRANPVPARFSHNTPVEIAWTVGPVLILMFIAIFSFKLLFAEHDMPKPYMTVKVTGRQWNWDYAYPDQKIPAATSIPLTEDDAKAQHRPYLLAASNPMVVPVGKVVKVEITAEDVIHSFSVPAFGVKLDAVPGRLNETWFKADHTGVFYGQCSQLCGANHSFMPIEVDVVTEDQFKNWVASKVPQPAQVAAAAPAASAKAE